MDIATYVTGAALGSVIGFAAYVLLLVVLGSAAAFARYPPDAPPLILRSPSVEPGVGRGAETRGLAARPVTFRWRYIGPAATPGGRHDAILKAIHSCASWGANVACDFDDWRAFVYLVNSTQCPPLASTGDEGRELDRLAAFALERAQRGFSQEERNMRQRARAKKGAAGRQPGVERRDAAIAAMYENAGSDAKQIAELTNLSLGSVYQALRRHGVALRRVDRGTRERDARLAAGRAAGQTLRALAAAEGMTAEGVRQALQRIAAERPA